MLRVISKGEPTVFYVESNALQCIGCSKLFNRNERHLEHLDDPDSGVYLHIGDRCPRCGGQLDVRFHQVDIAMFNCIGQCACEWFTYVALPKIAKMTREQQALSMALGPNCPLRCHHIKAARDFALDVYLTAHERSRGGNRENQAP